MPDGDKAGGASPAASSEGLLGRLSEMAWKALPAIGSAIGFAGFVAIVGGAIEWIRFDAAHLPATQAVLALPKQELVIEGARALIVFVVAAMLAALLVYLIDSKGNATPRTARGLVAVGGIGLLTAVVLIRGHHGWATYFLLIAALAWITLVAFYAVGLAMRDFRRRIKLKQAAGRMTDALSKLTIAEDARDASDVAVRRSDTDESKAARARAHGKAIEARNKFKRAIGEWKTAADEVIELHRSTTRASMQSKRDHVTKLADASPGRVELEVKLEDSEQALGNVFGAVFGQVLAAWKKLDPLQIAMQVILLCVGVAIFTLIAVGAAELPQQVLLLGLVVVLLTTMNIFVARATDKFAWYGISVFFSVLMFGAALTIASTLEQPKVQPVALVRKDNELGICGVYITQTNDRVYIGRLPLKGRRPGLIFWVPTSDVDLVSVGQPLSIGKEGDNTFSTTAEGMLARLYKDRAEEAAPALKNTTITNVSGDPSSAKGQTTTATETPPVKERSKRHPGVKIYERSCTSTQAVDP